MKLEQLLAGNLLRFLVQINEQDLSKITQAKDWQSKYRVLMQLGKKLPPVPEKMKQP